MARPQVFALTFRIELKYVEMIGQTKVNINFNTLFAGNGYPIIA